MLINWLFLFLSIFSRFLLSAQEKSFWDLQILGGCSIQAKCVGGNSPPVTWLYAKPRAGIKNATIYEQIQMLKRRSSQVILTIIARIRIQLNFISILCIKPTFCPPWPNVSFSFHLWNYFSLFFLSQHAHQLKVIIREMCLTYWPPLILLTIQYLTRPIYMQHSLLGVIGSMPSRVTRSWVHLNITNNT